MMSATVTEKRQDDIENEINVISREAIHSHNNSRNQIESTARSLENRLGDSHVNILPKKKLIICMLGMSVSLFAVFCDQTSVTVALPVIGRDLNAENTINWAGTSSLLANCVTQVLFGRFADIFGRKTMLLGCLGLLLVSNMLCGFAKTGPQFYVFRAFAGIGGGGSQCLAMVIVSDVVTLKQRGKYQGILGSNVALGNICGPLIMGAFVKRSSWRNFYRTLPPVIALVMVVVYFVGNSKKDEQPSVLTGKEKFRKIDYYGLFFATAGLTLLLIPISGGGSTYAWNSTLVIVMFVLGGVLLLSFLLVEWKIPELPMIPLYIFKNGSLSLLLFTTFLYGMVYYGLLYIVAYYFQLVRGFTEMRSAILLLPLVIPQSVMSAVAGSIISHIGHFLPIMYAGYSFWLAGCGMTIAWNRHTSVAMMAGTLWLIGSGFGFIFQPTIVAAQANSTKAQRAVVISTRNVLRSFGGSLGIAISSLIITNSFIKEINKQLHEENLPHDYLYSLKNSIYARVDMSKLTSAQVELIRLMYMTAIRNVFYFYLPVIGLCFLSVFFVKDNGLRCLDERDPDEKVVEEQTEEKSK